MSNCVPKKGRRGFCDPKSVKITVNITILLEMKIAFTVVPNQS